MKKLVLFVFFTLSVVASQAQAIIKISQLLDSTFVWNEKQTKEQIVRKSMNAFLTGKKLQKAEFIVTRLGTGNCIPVLFFEREVSDGLYSRTLVFFPTSFNQACEFVNDVAMYYHTYLPQMGYETELTNDLDGNNNMIFRNMTGGKTKIQFTAMRKHPLYDMPTFSILYMTK